MTQRSAEKYISFYYLQNHVSSFVVFKRQTAIFASLYRFIIPIVRAGGLPRVVECNISRRSLGFWPRCLR